MVEDRLVILKQMVREKLADVKARKLASEVFKPASRRASPLPAASPRLP